MGAPFIYKDLRRFDVSPFFVWGHYGAPAKRLHRIAHTGHPSQPRLDLGFYIEPGSPWQNGYIESFHSRFRDECLNREWVLNLREDRVAIEDWREHYNTERPHSRLGYLSPEGFIKHQNVSP